MTSTADLNTLCSYVNMEKEVENFSKSYKLKRENVYMNQKCQTEKAFLPISCIRIGQWKTEVIIKEP